MRQGEVIDGGRIWANVDNESVMFYVAGAEEVVFSVDPIASTAVYHVEYSANAGASWTAYSPAKTIGPATTQTDRISVIANHYRVRVDTPEGSNAWPHVYATVYRPWSE